MTFKELKRFAQWSYLENIAKEMFHGNPIKASFWMHMPHPDLNHSSPAEAILTGKGRLALKFGKKLKDRPLQFPKTPEDCL